MAFNCGSGLILDRWEYTVYVYSLEWLLIPLGVLRFAGIFLMDIGPLECNCPDRNEDILKENLHPSLWLSDC